MRNWLKIPREQRRELRQAYKQAGYSYMEAVKDFELPKMQQGGQLPHQTWGQNTGYEETLLHPVVNNFRNNLWKQQQKLAEKEGLGNTEINELGVENDYSYVDDFNHSKIQRDRALRDKDPASQEIPTSTPKSIDTSPISSVESKEEYKQQQVEQVKNNRLEVIENSIPIPDPNIPPVNLTMENPTKLQEFLIESGYNIGSTGVDGVVGKNTIKGLQQFLSDQGYDIGQDQFKNQGIDGVFGKKTRSALESFNADNLGISPDFGKNGFFGNRGKSWRCDRGSKQCAETVSHILYDYYGLTQEDVQRAGIMGNAWMREKNMLNADSPGQLLFKEESDLSKLNIAKPGDQVFLRNHTGHSRYQKQANNESRGYYKGQAPTHTGIIDSTMQYDSRGKPYVYVVHNISGNVFRDKLFFNENTGHPALKSSSSHGTIYRASSVVRPGVDVNDIGNVAINEDLKIQVNRENPIATNAANAVIDPKFRTDFRRYYGLSEEESLMISQVVLGIMEQETKMGEAQHRRIPSKVEGQAQIQGKESLAGALSSMKNSAPKTTQLVETVASPVSRLIMGRGINIPKEESRGWGQIKFDENFNDRAKFYETVFGITKDNISAKVDDGSNSARAASLIVATHYNRLRKTHSEEDALYLAVQAYNRNLNRKVANTGKNSIDFGKERDLDYSNKVLEYAVNYNIIDSEGNRLRTLIDDFNINEAVIRNQIRLSNK